VSDFVAAWGRQRKSCCGIAGCERSRRKRLDRRLTSRHRYLLPAGPRCCVDRLRPPTKSGQWWISARVGYDAIDPSATLAVHCGNGFDAGLPRYKRRGDCDLRTVLQHE
jgi:hypothetical protein